MHPKKLSNLLAKYGAEDKYFSGEVLHWCAGCKELHRIAVDKPFSNGAKWSFDGNAEKPTFSPSINIRIGPYGDGDQTIDVCHYFLKDGKIQYLDDCTHELKGLTIELPVIPEKYWSIWKE